MNLSLRKLQHIAGLSLKNGIRLHFDSISLFNIKSYPTALFISVIAMEEIGKAFWADHFVFYSKVGERGDKELEEEWINLLLGNHKGKQLSFLSQIYSEIDKKFYEFIKSNKLDRFKQNSIYVGLEKPKKGKPRAEGEIIDPSKIRKEDARKQILLVHKFLESNIVDSESGIIYHDLAIFRKLLNNELLIKLESKKIK